MPDPMSSPISFLWSKLGHCGKCIRKSFIAATLSCSIALIFIYCGPNYLALPAIAFAAGAALLWVAHITAFAVKVSMKRRAAASPSIQPSRRALLGSFARSMAAVALFSALPRVAMSRNSDCPCPCNGNHTCDSNAPSCWGWFCSGDCSTCHEWVCSSEDPSPC